MIRPRVLAFVSIWASRLRGHADIPASPSHRVSSAPGTLPVLPHGALVLLRPPLQRRAHAKSTQWAQVVYYFCLEEEALTGAWLHSRHGAASPPAARMPVAGVQSCGEPARTVSWS